MSTALQNRVYVITGGASGFGRAIANALVAAGARVALLGRNRAALDTAVAELGEQRALGLVADVQKRGELVAAFAGVVEHFGVLDGLVNNAGVARPGAVEQLREEEVFMQVNTNFLGTVFGCQAAIPLLRHSENPRIVNISSASAWHYDEMHHLSIYAATKAAVERFSRDLRVELQEDGIGVTCIRPGAAWTKFANDWDADRLAAGVNAWHGSGPTMDAGMTAANVADAVLYVLNHPAGVAVDLLEIRPNQPVPKIKL
jgi:NAD(P)-dependent dehydrogenase (short-subunit alcohol dehydrogenase family)